jgi:hypothetical protein
LRSFESEAYVPILSSGRYQALSHRRYLLEAKTRYLLKLLFNGSNLPTALFFPMSPHPRSGLPKLCYWTGCRVVTDATITPDVAIYWDTSTRRAATIRPPQLNGMKVINERCTDVSKENVDRTFARVFGYDIRVDPRAHTGPCVKKSNENALHDGVILSCPVADLDAGYVYQRLIDTGRDDLLVESLRVPVFADTIPLIYRKLSDPQERFSADVLTAYCCETSVVLSHQETRLILTFCRELGLDYGELDVLRERKSGRLYIVDANPTPWGPPCELAWRDQPYALRTLGKAFEHMVFGHALA